MKTWLERLASLKLAVAILLVLAVALAAGTVVELRAGTEAAARTVYDALYFRALLALLALNVVAALATRLPWTDRTELPRFLRLRAGFLLTHTSILLVFAGALVTERFQVEGQMALVEGQEADSFVAGEERLTLPFHVRLEAFEIDYHPGTRSPATYRSRLAVRDAGGESFAAVVEPNHELRHLGWRLYQTSYRMSGGTRTTVLTVSRDPGEWIVYAGFAMLLAGLVTVFATRVAHRRALGALLLAVAAGTVPSEAAEPADAATAAELRRLVVQHDGRLMPLDTLARESTWKVTGRHRWKGIDPVALVLGWAFDPTGWIGEDVVYVGSDLASELALAGEHASYRTLSNHAHFSELLEEARATRRDGGRTSYLGQTALDVEARLFVMQSFFNRQAFRVLPAPGDSGAAWQVPRRLRSAADLAGVHRSLQGAPADHRPGGDVGLEIAYNRIRPVRLAWWILLAAAILAFWAWRRPAPGADVLAVGSLVGGWGVVTLGIALRWRIGGRIPAADMYESLLVLGWGVGFLALVALVVLRDRFIPLNATAVAALTLGLADNLPIDPFIHPVPPVLSGTVWLAIHVPIILLSYAVLTLAMLAAHVRIVLHAFRRDAAGARRLDDLLYWYLHAGSLLLIAGVLSGSVWAASSWGRYWGWDPKEVWSLIAFLAYMAILHGRADGFLRPFGVAAASILAYWTILMTYLGVNFLLGGLHSYGFGAGTVMGSLLTAAGAEGLFLAAAFWAVRRAPSGRESTLSPTSDVQ